MDRRSFLLGAGAGAVVLATPPIVEVARKWWDMGAAWRKREFTWVAITPAIELDPHTLEPMPTRITKDTDGLWKLNPPSLIVTAIDPIGRTVTFNGNPYDYFGKFEGGDYLYVAK